MNVPYNVNIKCIALSSQMELNKKYVLTKTENEWDPPTLALNNEWFPNIEKNLIDKMKNLIFVNDLELLPQVVSVKQNDDQQSIDIIYGFIIGYTESLNECFWLEFDFLQEKPYSQIIFEVIQKLN